MTNGWPSHRSLDGGIDEIPLPTSAGRLWLCGKHLVGPDPERTLERVDATAIVCLTEAHELMDRYPQYVAWLRYESRRSPDPRAHWHPIPDLHAPSLDDLHRLLDVVERRLRAGEGVIVHCGAGIGRAGTTAVAVLMRFGVPMQEAMATVRRHRPMAGPEAGAQEALLEALAAELAED